MWWYIYMYIYVDICIPRTLYMYKISTHKFFKTLLLYIYIRKALKNNINEGLKNI